MPIRDLFQHSAGGVEDRFLAAAASESPSTTPVGSSSSAAAAAAASKLEVGSMVEVDLSPQPNQFGVIRWIGQIAKSDNRLCLAAGERLWGGGERMRRRVEMLIDEKGWRC